jgi:phosphate:Na+ symporter
MDMMTILSLLGGLGMFLFGMQMMSDGLQQVAGARMRSILEFFTRNRFIGMIVGLVFTGIIQSSSATTVMVVSFVNSGLMNLSQASGVILGANIGTTVTGQLIAFNLSDVAPLFIFVGAAMYMFTRNQTAKKIGVVILGFGILFMGMNTMSEATAALKESPQIVSVMQSLQNPVLGILVGLVVTAALQSSSAAVGILIMLANQGMMELPMCLYMILGSNIGACVSAMLVSLNGKKDAKRAAWIHLLFNIISSAIICVIIAVAMNPVCSLLMDLSGGGIGRAVANANTLFKVFGVIILFPFMDWIIKLTYRIIPGEDAAPEGAYELKYIGKGNVITSTTAIVDVIHELVHMGETARENVQRGMEALCTKDEKKIEEVYRQEEYIDYLSRTITDYLVKLSSMELPTSDAKTLGALFHVVNDIERIGDYAENFADYAKDRIEKNINFSEKAEKQLMDMTDLVMDTLNYSLEMFSGQNPEHMREVIQLEDEVDEREKKLQRSHVKRLTKGRCTPEAGILFSDTISGLERVADHAVNVAFATLEPNYLDEEDEED